MAIPSDLIDIVEKHPCISGCWSSSSPVTCVVDPGRVERLVEIYCSDCLSFHCAVSARLLTVGWDQYKLAREVTEHVRRQRNYRLSTGGYHTAGKGLWLSVGYWAHLGLFVMKQDTSKQPRLTALITAFQHGVLPPLRRGMMNPKNYQTHDTYLRIDPLPTARTVPDLLASSSVSARPHAGYVSVVLAEYLPVSRKAGAAGTGANASSAPPAPAPVAAGGPAGVVTGAATSANAGAARAASHPAPPVVRAVGQPCPLCREVVEEKPLLATTYMSCACDRT